MKLRTTLASAAPALAPRVDAREVRQEQRIEQGQATGALTPHESHRLERQQKGITKVENKARADGTVTPQERQRLAHLQNHASRDIRHQKHDAQATAPR